LALAVLALVVFGAYDSYPFRFTEVYFDGKIKFVSFFERFCRLSLAVSRNGVLLPMTFSFRAISSNSSFGCVLY